MNEHQAIFDAVRSRLNNCDVGDAVRSAVSLELSGASSYLNDIRQEAYFHIGQVASAMQLPSAIYRPRIFMDGNKWCALYGENIQEGVAGFGDSPQEAMMDFDANWIKEGGWNETE